MAVAANKRSVMTLFSHADDMYSHQTRIVLAEKGVGVDITLVDLDNLPEDLIDLNPYGTVKKKIAYTCVSHHLLTCSECCRNRFKDCKPL